MAKTIKVAWFFGVFALALSFISVSQASINTTISAWSASPVVLGDATWTYVSNLGLGPTTTPITFTDNVVNGVENDTVTFGDASHLLAPGVYDLKYTITLNPGTTFTSASLGVDLTGTPSAATVKKILGTSPPPTYIDTLKSVNGQTVSSTTVNGLTKLYVDDLVSITQGSVLSITNDFTTKTSSVPEPGSLAIWGLLGAGLITFGAFRSRFAS